MIVRRYRVGLTAVDLDEEALHAIEAELQAGQAAAFALAPFEIEQELLGVAAEQAQLIELCIVAWRDHAAVAKKVRRRVDDRANQQRVFVAMIAELLEQHA